jgi:LacI family transcriptional regulator
VLTGSTRSLQQWFSERRFHCLIVGSAHPGVELPSVDIAYRAACRHAAGQLLARGHQRLAFLNPDSGAAGDLESERGFKEAVAQASLASAEGVIIRHDGTIADICNKLDASLRRRHPPTGWLVSRPTHVLTAMGHLARRGLRLPQNVALISRDHDPFLADVVPSVARYVASPAGMAHRISRVVREMIQDGVVRRAPRLVIPKFTEGETLGPKTVRSPAAEARGAGRLTDWSKI